MYLVPRPSGTQDGEKVSAAVGFSRQQRCGRRLCGAPVARCFRLELQAVTVKARRSFIVVLCMNYDIALL